MSPLAPYPLLHVGASIAWNSFTIHWSTVVGLLVLAATYEFAARRNAEMGNPRVPAKRAGEMGSRSARDASRAHSRFPISDFRRWCFYGGLATIFLSLNGWLHDLSDYYLFSAHMVQHLLLTLLVPPLLILGTPGWMLRPLVARRAVARVARILTNPKVCFATFNVVIAAWHLPVLYNVAMARHG